MSLLERALAEGVLRYVSGPGHKMDCAAMLWVPQLDGGRALKGTAEDACNCERRDDNFAKAELRQLAERVLGERP